MSLNVMMAVCVLACDFLIYAFFQWTFGEKRREFARRGRGRDRRAERGVA